MTLFALKCAIHSKNNLSIHTSKLKRTLSEQTLHAVTHEYRVTVAAKHIRQQVHYPGSFCCAEVHSLGRSGSKIDI